MSLEFQVKILMLSFVVTVVLSIFIIPILRKLNIAQVERENGPSSHIKKQGTPTMGGITMIFAMVISAVRWIFVLL